MDVAEAYRCVLLDPPWPERGGGKIKRGADRHYPVMSVAAIQKLILCECEPWISVAHDAHMWMWCTDNYLESGLDLVRGLGFRYIRMAVWTKDRFGLGQYMRGQHEVCLFAVSGRLKAQRRDVSSWIGQKALPRRRHSQKPDEQYDHIEAVSPGPYLELFARHTRPGWTSWGNEVS